jgi:hypothetical protein
MKTTIDRFLWMIPIVLAALVVFTDARPAVAQQTCVQDLRDCFGRAAGRERWWDRWVEGLDCELSFADCARRSVVGH